MADYKEDVLVDKVEVSSEYLAKKIEAFMALGYAVTVSKLAETDYRGFYEGHTYTIYVYKPTDWDYS